MPTTATSPIQHSAFLDDATSMVYHLLNSRDCEYERMGIPSLPCANQELIQLYVPRRRSIIKLAAKTPSLTFLGFIFTGQAWAEGACKGVFSKTFLLEAEFTTMIRAHARQFREPKVSRRA